MMNGIMVDRRSGDGRPDINKIKAFMEQCGKQDFDEEKFTVMEQFCDPEGKPDAKQMKQFMENCGCYVS
jgi:hypothetical protein